MAQGRGLYELSLIFEYVEDAWLCNDRRRFNQAKKEFLGHIQEIEIGDGNGAAIQSMYEEIQEMQKSIGFFHKLETWIMKLFRSKVFETDQQSDTTTGTKQVILSSNSKLILHQDAGKLFHAFGDGYSIRDEYGRAVNSFNEEAEFNRLIGKFRYRELLVQKLNESYKKKFEFGESNMLIVDGEVFDDMYWNLPESEEEVDVFFNVISDEFSRKMCLSGLVRR